MPSRQRKQRERTLPFIGDDPYARKPRPLTPEEKAVWNGWKQLDRQGSQILAGETRRETRLHRKSAEAVAVSARVVEDAGQSLRQCPLCGKAFRETRLLKHVESHLRKKADEPKKTAKRKKRERRRASSVMSRKPRSASKPSGAGGRLGSTRRACK